jgi:hypothetical protein
MDMIAPSGLPTLQQCGFEFLTCWELRNEKIKPQTVTWDDCSGWIYAFVTEGRVRYFGIATTVLRSRLDGYAYQINDRVGALIGALLNAGGKVEIFGTRRRGISKTELEVEESRLIKMFSADWNVQE